MQQTFDQILMNLTEEYSVHFISSSLQLLAKDNQA